MSVVLVPRGGAWGASVAAAAADAGLSPWVLPLIETLPAPSDELSDALTALATGAYDWLAVTSAAAVPALAQVSVPEHTKIAAVGPATASALARAGHKVDLIGDYGAEGLLAGWPATPAGRVLAVQSDIAKPVLVDGLHEARWQVDAVVAYRTASTRLSSSEEYALRSGKADIALVTSGSVAHRLADTGIPAATHLVAIGTQTASDVAALGLVTAAVAASPTVADLVRAAHDVARQLNAHQLNADPLDLGSSQQVWGVG